jgi:hypothetical protein
LRLSGHGNVWGRKKDAAVLVLTFASPDGTQVMVFAGGPGPEAERLRNLLRQRAVSGPADEDAPARFGSDEAGGLTVRWRFQKRLLTPPLRFFEPVATVVLEKRGYQVGGGTPQVVLGGAPYNAVAAFVAPGSNAYSRHLVFTFAETAPQAEEVSAGLLREITAFLYR